MGGETPAIFLERPGRLGWERQVAACEAYLAEHRYRLVARVSTHPDAFALVFNGLAKVVVAAKAADDDWRLERLLAQVHGRLEVARSPQPQKPAHNGHDTEEIVVRMASRGGTADVIAELLGVAEERVRAIITRTRGRR